MLMGALFLLAAVCSAIWPGESAAIIGEWEEQTSGVQTALFGLSFINERQGWVVGASGVILHTVDGGVTWERQASGKTNDLYGVDFVSLTDGWAVGDNVILQTTDGGRTWTSMYATTRLFRSISLLGPWDGWVVGDRGSVVRIKDGAVVVQLWPRILFTMGNLHDVDFLDGKTGWYVSAFRSSEHPSDVYRTTDGGLHWERKHVEAALSGAHFIDADEGWAVGEKGAIFHTTDGGVSWERQRSSAEVADLKDVFFVDENEGWVVGEAGLILRTFDGGKVWARQIWEKPTGQGPAYPDLNRVVFVGPLEGWAVGSGATILHFLGQYETITAFPETPLLIRKGTVILGAGGHPWDESGTLSGLVVEAGGSSLHAARLDTLENLVACVREGQGRIWSTLPVTSESTPEHMIDADPWLDTAYEKSGLTEPATIYVDLGEPYPVHLVLLALAPTQTPDFALPQRLQVGLNDGDPHDLDAKGAPLLHPIWSQKIDGYNRQAITFPPQPARYIGITISETPALRIYDLKVFGDGYVPRSTFTSEVIDFGDASVWGNLRWAGTQEPGTEILIRTRTGDDDDPNVYWRRIGYSDRYTDRTEAGTQLTRYDYDALPSYKRGPITFDAEHWSYWSAPYPFDLGGVGLPIQSPDARRYLQVGVEFRNTVDAAGQLRSITVEASQPTSASLILAEIVPPEVVPARTITFTYGLRPRFTGGDIGFDSVEILTPVRPTAVRSVMVDSTVVPFTSELRDDPPGLSVRIPELGFLQDNAVVEISFDCVVFRYGTAFPGRIYNSRHDMFHQRVVPGDALEGVGEDDIVVRTNLESPLLLLSGPDPDPFTPNGDGVNDMTDISYTILKLSAVAPIRIDIYDLNGRLVRHLYTGKERDGQHRHPWDGRDETGQVVPPGIYLYRITLDADVGHQATAGTVHVVY